MSIITNNEQVIDKIKQKLNEHIPNLLHEYDAIIAGGFVLGNIVDVKFSDIDIYVNRKNAIEFIKHLLQDEHDDNIVAHRILSASPYDTSFFYKNKILARYTFKIQEYDIDVLIVDDEKNVVDVAKNFDLSFCEVWYDGIAVYANNEEHVINMKGILNPDYVESLVVYKNKFIIKRIKKYFNRGFKISYTYDNKIISLKLPTKKIDETNYELWVINMIRQIVYDNNLKLHIESLQYKKFIDFHNFLIHNAPAYNYKIYILEIYDKFSEEYKRIFKNVFLKNGIEFYV